MGPSLEGRATASKNWPTRAVTPLTAGVSFSSATRKTAKWEEESGPTKGAGKVRPSYLVWHSARKSAK